jgi:hypothetical protein
MDGPVNTPNAVAMLYLPISRTLLSAGAKSDASAHLSET